MSIRLTVPTGPKPLQDSPYYWWVTERGWIHLIDSKSGKEWCADLRQLPTMMDLVTRTYLSRQSGYEGKLWVEEV